MLMENALSNLGDSFGNFKNFVLPEISDGISPVKDFIGDVGLKFVGVVDNLGPEINLVGTLITAATVILFPELGVLELVSTVQTISGLVSAIAKSFLDIDGDIDAADIGMRAEASGDKPEDYDSYSEYIEHLDKDVEQDTPRLESLSDEERMAYSLAGMGIMNKAIAENTGIEIKPETYVDAVKTGMNDNELRATIDCACDEGMEEMPRLGDYLSGDKLNGKQQSEMREILIDGISSANPEMSEVEVKDRIFDMKEMYQPDTIDEV